MIKELVEDWTKKIENDLIENYNRIGLKASGNWEKELESQVKISPKSINIRFLGSSYTGVLTQGRKPNKNQEPSKLRAWVGWAGSTFLKDWVNQKNISANPFAVAYKIAREGIKVPNSHNPGTLVSDAINDSSIQKLIDDLKIFVIDDIKSDII